MELFWKKKTVVSFVLSIFIFWIHIASFGQYLLTSSGESVSRTIVIFCSSIFTDTFSRLAVPLFFIISGAVLFRDYDNSKYAYKVKSRIWSLLIPYLFWNVVGMLFEIVTSYTFISKFFLSREKFVLTIPNVIEGIFFYKCNGPFWFICTLIIFVIISPIFEFLAKRKTTAFISVLLFILLSQFDVPVISTLLYKTSSLTFYMVGCIIGKHYMRQFTSEKGKLFSIVSLCIFLICTVIWFFRSIGVLRFSVVVNIILLTIYALSFWVAADLMLNIKKISVKPIFYDNFFIYAMHINVSAIIVKLLYLVMPKDVIFAIPNFILSTVLTLTVILFFAKILRKKTNQLYLLISGKKMKVGSS